MGWHAGAGLGAGVKCATVASGVVLLVAAEKLLVAAALDVLVVVTLLPPPAATALDLLPLATDGCVP
jgi:hypothetical protein